MMILLLVAPAIILSDVPTRQDEHCTKPYTLSPSGKCVRRIAGEDETRFRSIDNGRHDDDYGRLLEMLDAIDHRCTGRRCR